LEDAEITVRADRIERPPQGAAGGRAGKPGSYMITTASGQARPLRGKQTSVAIEAGDIFTMISSGGGGFGEPFERDPAAVARDVLSGAVTADAAAEEYGVVLGGDQLGVDAPATTERRASQRAGEAA
jgi:N-methylhydantoinase B